MVDISYQYIPHQHINYALLVHLQNLYSIAQTLMFFFSFIKYINCVIFNCLKTIPHDPFSVNCFTPLFPTVRVTAKLSFSP